MQNYISTLSIEKHYFHDIHTPCDFLFAQAKRYFQITSENRSGPRQGCLISIFPKCQKCCI